MNQPSFLEMTKELGELSGADPRPFPNIRQITTEVAKLDLRQFDSEELAQITCKRTNHHDD